MKILLDNVPVEFDALQAVHDSITACWDRDGVGELVERGAFWTDQDVVGANALRDEVHHLDVATANVRVWTAPHFVPAESGAIAIVCLGRSYLAAAQFLADPVPHWVVLPIGDTVSENPHPPDQLPGT